MVNCSAPLCENDMRFKFPRDNNLKNKWLEFINKPYLLIKSGYGLCEYHFKNHQIQLENQNTG